MFVGFATVDRMVRGVTAEPELIDGRHARRERGRAAVIDAVFELVHEGRVPPPVEEVAERAGVSASSIFRYFDGLEDMQHQALATFRDRFGHLFDIAPTPDASRPARIAAFVDARIELYATVGVAMSLSRLRALEHPPMAAATAEQRQASAEQVAAQFDPVLAPLPRARRADVVAIIDSLTSPEGWNIMRRSHDRTPRQIKRAWTLAITAVLADTEATP